MITANRLIAPAETVQATKSKSSFLQVTDTKDTGESSLIDFVFRLAGYQGAPKPLDGLQAFGGDSGQNFLLRAADLHKNKLVLVLISSIWHDIR